MVAKVIKSSNKVQLSTYLPWKVDKSFDVDVVSI